MAFLGRSVLLVVPARGGSRGIPRKNLRCIGGATLVARAAAVASALPWVDAAVLSTDDDEIAAEGEHSGLAVPFRRPPELAGDLATAIDTWRHAWLASEAHFARSFDVSVLLEPTSPLRTPADVERALSLLVETGARSVASVTRTPGHYTPERTLCVEPAAEGGGPQRLRPYLADGLGHTSRQTIPPYYHRNGVVYAVTRESLVEHGNLMADGCVPLVIERPVVNIDDPLDLELATLLLERGEPGTLAGPPGASQRAEGAQTSRD